MSALAVCFRLQVVRPVISRLGLRSDAAENLLIMVAAHESGGWTFVRQYPEGPARGLFQMEEATLTDLFESWVKYRPQWRDKLRHEFGAQLPQPDRLVFDAQYACAMARMQIYRDPEKLPAHDDLDGLAAYAKRVWNGPGKATPALYREAYERHVLTA